MIIVFVYKKEISIYPTSIETIWSTAETKYIFDKKKKEREAGRQKER